LFLPAQNLAVKALVTPVLIGGASLAGRRFGHQIGGWLVALPMTSGPVALFLALDQGASFAAGAAFLHWSANQTFVLVLAGLGVGYLATRRRTHEPPSEPAQLPRWDIPVRMIAATAVVMFITTLAPVLGSHLAGLLSPFPVFAAVLAVFTHHTHGPTAATQTLDGLVLGLLAPTVFFLVLALTLQQVGLPAFAFATAAAFAAQALSLLAIPRQPPPAP
jgi:uncharacterized membrane protein (GlpM family)